MIGVGSRHGLLAGAELGGGLQFPVQGAIGYQTSDHRVYARADAVIDTATSDADGSRPTLGARVGAGLGWSLAASNDGARLGPVLAAGPSLGWVIDGPAACGSARTVLELSVEVRYAGEWQLVLAPRITRGEKFCI